MYSMNVDAGKNINSSPLAKARVALPAALLVFVGCSLLFPPNHSMWVDETSSYFFSSLPWAAFIEHLAKAEANMSLYYLALKLHMLTGLESPFYLRSLSVIFGLLSIVCMYQFSRTYISRQVAFWVVIIAAFNPFIYKYFWEARSYSLVLLFGILNLWLFWRAIVENQRKHWIIYALVAGLGLYSHIFLVLLLVAQYSFALIYLCSQRKLFPQYWFNLLLAGSLLTTVAAPLLYFFITVAADASNINWIETVGISHTWDFLENIYKSKYSYSPIPASLSVLLLAFCALGSAYTLVSSAVKTGQTARSYLVLYLGICALLPVLLAYGLQAFKPMFVERYLIYTVPAFLILNCLLACSIKNQWARLIIFCALCVTQAYGMVENHARDKFNFEAVYLDLSSNCTPGSQLVFAKASVVTTYLYYRSNYPELERCFDSTLPEQLGYTNFYNILEFEELPKPKAGQQLWFILGHAGSADNSIYKIQDPEALADAGYSRSFHKSYPIKLALIRLEPGNQRAQDMPPGPSK